MKPHKKSSLQNLKQPTKVEPNKTDNHIDDLFMLRDPSPVGKSHYSLHLSEDSSGFGSIKNESSCTEESSSDESENDVDANEEIPGELALDMFIDPLNPNGKAAHPTLKSKIKKLMEKEEFLKLRRINQLKLEIETKKLNKKIEKENNKKQILLDRLSKKYENLLVCKESARVKHSYLSDKLNNLQIREQNYYSSLKAWTSKKEHEWKELLTLGSVLEQDYAQLRQQLNAFQKERAAIFKEKIDPIVIRDGPSQKTNYKIQAKYLQYEIYPLTQRLKMLSMRVEHEESRRRNVEREVSQLREKISELNIRVVAASKGISVNKAMSKKIEEHKMRWKRFLNEEIAVKKASKEVGKS